MVHAVPFAATELRESLFLVSDIKHQHKRGV